MSFFCLGYKGGIDFGNATSYDAGEAVVEPAGNNTVTATANTEGIHSYNENVDIEDVINAGQIYVMSLCDMLGIK